LAGVAVDVETRVSGVLFAENLREELASRLDRFAAHGAAQRVRQRGWVRQDDKPVVREVLARWRQSLGPAPVAETLWELQAELGRGLTRSLYTPVD
jgi:hypothetical protein